MASFGASDLLALNEMLQPQEEARFHFQQRFPSPNRLDSPSRGQEIVTPGSLGPQPVVEPEQTEKKKDPKANAPRFKRQCSIVSRNVCEYMQ